MKSLNDLADAIRNSFLSIVALIIYFYLKQKLQSQYPASSWYTPWDYPNWGDSLRSAGADVLVLVFTITAVSTLVSINRFKNPDKESD